MNNPATPPTRPNLSPSGLNRPVPQQAPQQAPQHRPPAPAGAPISVLLVDDHDLIRRGLAAAFGRDTSVQVVAQAGSVAEGLAQYRATRPQVVVTDLQLPDGTGLDLVRRVRGAAPDAGLVVLTMHSGDDQILAAMEAGASAFVGKEAPAEAVVKAARHAHLSPRTFVAAGLAGAMTRRAAAASSRLTEREADVLALLGDGLGAAQIARRLYLSESTAKSHITRIYQKLGAANRAQALVAAMRLGLLNPRP